MLDVSNQLFKVTVQNKTFRKHLQFISESGPVSLIYKKADHLTQVSTFMWSKLSRKVRVCVHTKVRVLVHTKVRVCVHRKVRVCVHLCGLFQNASKRLQCIRTLFCLFYFIFLAFPLAGAGAVKKGAAPAPALQLKLQLWPHV